MNVLITGGTGFIGTALCPRLQADGHHVTVLTRDASRSGRHFSGRVPLVESLSTLDERNAPDAIVNLAGENLGKHRWNTRRKQAFVDSRVGVTGQLVDYIGRARKKPRVLVSGSAVGYYGARGDESLTEGSLPGSEYQSELCRAWESAALKAQEHGIRVCLLRTGIVLGDGGALKAMLTPFRLGLGGHLGDGRQWMSWIHMDDLIGIIQHLIARDNLSGPFNGTAPNPETNREFSRRLGMALHRPAIVPLPPVVVRLMMGEMAHLLLTGQKVLPQRVLESGYDYRHPSLTQAFAALFGK